MVVKERTVPIASLIDDNGTGVEEDKCPFHGIWSIVVGQSERRRDP